MNIYIKHLIFLLALLTLTAMVIYMQIMFTLHVLFIVWIFGLVSLLRNRLIDVHDKITWVVVVLLLLTIGSTAYIVYIMLPEDLNSYRSSGTRIDRLPTNIRKDILG